MPVNVPFAVKSITVTHHGDTQSCLDAAFCSHWILWIVSSHDPIKSRRNKICVKLSHYLASSYSSTAQNNSV